MPWFEYTDMFERAQTLPVEAAPYRMLVIDIANSKQLGGYNGYALNDLIEEIISILDSDGVFLFPDFPCSTTWVSFKNGYASLGDMRACCIDELSLRKLLGIETMKFDILAEETITAYFQELLSDAVTSTLFPYVLHWEHGRFETFDWSEGTVKYAVSYAPQQLEDISKRSGKIICPISPV